MTVIEQLYNQYPSFGNAGSGWSINLLIYREYKILGVKIGFEFKWAEGAKRPPNVNNAVILPDGRRLAKFINNTNHIYAIFKVLIPKGERIIFQGLSQTTSVVTKDDSEYYMFSGESPNKVHYFVETAPGNNNFVYWAESQYVIDLLLHPQPVQGHVQPHKVVISSIPVTFIGRRNNDGDIEYIDQSDKVVLFNNNIKQVGLFIGIIVVCILITKLIKK